MTCGLKVALITGGAKRLGKEITCALANNGYKVAIHYFNSGEQAEELANSINSGKNETLAITCKADLINEKERGSLVGKVVEDFGRIDLLVNNASIFERTKLPDIDIGEQDLFHSVHVKAPLRLSLDLAAHLLNLGRKGCIINLVDIHADFALKGYTPYAISKAGLKTMTRQLALELAPDILVNAIAPGAILEPAESSPGSTERITAKIPLKRFGKPSDIAKTVIFLADSDYITGQTIVVDGGRTLSV